MMLGCAIFLSAACNPEIDDGVGLRALEGPLVAVGQEVLRVSDDKLTAAYRDLAASWEAALGEAPQN